MHFSISATTSNQKQQSNEPTPPVSAAPKSVAIRKKAAVDITKPSVALKRKASSDAPQNSPKDDNNDTDDLISYAKVPKATDLVGDLMLNTFTAPVSNLSKKVPKFELNRHERLKQKRAERQGDGALKKHTLSHGDIKSGIRKFSQNPNQKPRASDLYLQREKQEAQKSQTNEDKVEEPELGHVDAQARKANAFRVKRPGDSSVRKIGLFKDQPEKIELGQRLVRPITEKIFDDIKVDSLDLHAHTVKNLLDLLGITQLTTAQQKTIPKALEGKFYCIFYNNFREI